MNVQADHIVERTMLPLYTPPFHVGHLLDRGEWNPRRPSDSEAPADPAALIVAPSPAVLF